MKKRLCVIVAAAAAGGWTAELRQVVIVSRHNLRAPLGTATQNLAESTTNKWFAWTSAPGTKAMSSKLGKEFLPPLAKRLERGEPRLTFVGGHDTTLAQVGTQLDVEPYELPAHCISRIHCTFSVGTAYCNLVKS